MKRRTTLTLTTMALLCFTVVLPVGDAAAQQKTLKDQLVGAWMVVAVEVTSPTGVKGPIGFLGANAKGILIIDAGGRYADVTMRPDRPKFKASGNFRLNTPAAEWGEAALGFSAEFGTWSINEADKTITWRIEGHLNPNNEGTENKETIISLTGDELKTVETTGAGNKLEWVFRRNK